MRRIAGAIVLMFLAAGVGATQGNNDSVVLVPVSELEWVTNPRGASFAYPWKVEGGSHGDLARFSAGFDTGPHTHSASYRGVVIAGVLMNPAEGESTSSRLPPGSSWYVAGGIVHSTKCVSDDCVFYVHQEAPFDFNPVR